MNDWSDVHRLLADIRADGYDVDDVQTDTSLATVDDKRIEICVSRAGTAEKSAGTEHNEERGPE